VVVVATRAEAGPPLLCDPFAPGPGATLLPWDADAPGWNAPDPSYDRRRLVDDTLRLLSPDATILARMENLRRATIYATGDAQVARALLDALVARTRTATGGSSRDALAWFDAGYLIETYRQATHIARYDMLSTAAPRDWTLTREPAADGYALVKKALALAGPNAAMEYAASLMTAGAVSVAHRDRAAAGAPAGSVLARHVARSAR
jgi:hypothetical protein